MTGIEINVSPNPPKKCQADYIDVKIKRWIKMLEKNML